MEEEFLLAAKLGHIEKVKECLKAKVDISITNPSGLNALHFASRENHPEIVKLLLNHGCNINLITKRLNTALHIASLGGNTVVAKLLIQHGASVNVQAKDDITPLYMAAQENHIDTVNILLENGANPHIAAKGGYEPIDIAVQQGHSKVAVMLLEKESKQGLRALHLAAKKDDVKALQLLLKDKVNINERAPNGYTPLHVAAKYGSPKAANFLIDNGAELNAPAKHNIVPLHVASRHGKMNVLAVLIEAGANLSVATRDGLTALHLAAKDGHSHSVELLLVHGAPVTAKTKHGLTALHTAAQGNHTSCASLLLTHGAHIDDVTLDGLTPLHVTAHYGYMETAKLLIEKGADINGKARNGYTALHVAAKKNREAIVQLLLSHNVIVHLKNNNGQTPLHVAVYFGHVNIVLLLMQNGASLEAKTIKNETVLHIACRTTQIQIVRLLLRNRANVDATTKDQDTPLHVACLQGSASMVSLLLDNEADPNLINSDGCSALHLACRDGLDRVAESLLDHHADVNVLSKRGFSPLHEAAKKGHLEIIEMLLEKRADANLHGKNTLTPLHIACHYHQPEAAMRLLKAGSDPHATAKNGFTVLHICARKNQIKLVSLLLERGVQADTTTRLGVSPLHLAAQEGNPEIVDMLLEHGSSPGAQTMNGLTPLHIAVHYNRVEVVKRLLKYGAPVNTPTQSCFTPLHLAALYGHIEVAEILLEEGADVEAKTKNGNTPLHLASNNGHEEIIELLLKYKAPPNALNKDGYSALHVAKVLQQKYIITILTKVTKINLTKTKNASMSEDLSITDLEKVRRSFLPPENLEESLLVDEAMNEVHDEDHTKMKIIPEDFEESFAGLDDSRSEENKSQQTINESEINFVDQSEVMSSQNYDDYFKNLDNESENKNESVKLDKSDLDIDESLLIGPGRRELKKENNNVDREIFQSSEQHDIESNSQIKKYKETLKQGRFLMSFNIDAFGGIMESRQSGVRFIMPRDACEMPTRITCKLRRPGLHVGSLKLSVNESIVSHVLHLAPEGTQFLKPVVLEVPHHAVMSDKSRELVVLRYVGSSSSWQEHTSTIIDDTERDNEKEPRVKVILQDLPDKLTIISRPLKERTVMPSEGGTFQSSVVPNAKIVFPPNTLNTSTPVVLQTQKCMESLLPPEEQLHLSPIVALYPPTILSKPITINIPCRWLNSEERSNRGTLRLLSWMVRSPRKSTIEKPDYEWKDITNKTALQVIGSDASFTTTDFTRYWLVQSNSIESLLKRMDTIEESVSSTPYRVRINIQACLLNKKVGLRIMLATDDMNIDQLSGVKYGHVTVAQSDYVQIYGGQMVYVNLSGNLATSNSKKLKILFKPFQTNRLDIKTYTIDEEMPKSCRVIFIGSLRKETGSQKMGNLCSLHVDIPDELLQSVKLDLPEDTVTDKVIKSVSISIQGTWYEFADELGLTNRDKQAVADITCGRNDVASIRLLEYWRSKNPRTSTYKNLYDALKRFGLAVEAENVYNSAPQKFSTDFQMKTIHKSQTNSKKVEPQILKAEDSNKENQLLPLQVESEQAHISQINEVGMDDNKNKLVGSGTYTIENDLNAEVNHSNDILNSIPENIAMEKNSNELSSEQVIRNTETELDIDFNCLGPLIEDLPALSETEKNGPSAYELSLLRIDTESAHESITEKPKPTGDVITENLIEDEKIQVVHSEINIESLDEVNNTEPHIKQIIEKQEVENYGNDNGICDVPKLKNDSLSDSTSLDDSFIKSPDHGQTSSNGYNISYPSSSDLDTSMDYFVTETNFSPFTDTSSQSADAICTDSAESDISFNQIEKHKESDVSFNRIDKHKQSDVSFNQIDQHKESSDEIIQRVFKDQTSVLDFFKDEGSGTTSNGVVVTLEKSQTTV